MCCVCVCVVGLRIVGRCVWWCVVYDVCGVLCVCIMCCGCVLWSDPAPALARASHLGVEEITIGYRDHSEPGMRAALAAMQRQLPWLLLGFYGVV